MDDETVKKHEEVTTIKVKGGKKHQMGMVEEQVDMEYISFHGYIRNTTSDTEVLAEYQGRADRST